MADVNKNISQIQLNQTLENFDGSKENNPKTSSKSIYVVGGDSKSELVKNIVDNDSSSEDEDLGLSNDIISFYIGETGRWQFFWQFILCLFQFPITFHIFCLVFQAAPKDFWCARPDHLKSISVEHWRNVTQPKDGCSMIKAPYDVLSDTIFNEYFNANQNQDQELIKCESFEFDMNLIGNTIISEWTLICDKLYMGSIVEMCFLAGAALGSVFSGWVSDRYGRKHTLMAFALLQVVCGLSMGFATQLKVYMALRFFAGVASMASTVVSFVLVVELVDGKWRTIMGILNILPVAMAYVVCAGIAYFTYHWRSMQFAITSPMVALLMLWYYYPESPRWLLARGRIDELAKMIELAARWNNRQLPPHFEKTLTSSQTDSERKVSVTDLFQKGYKLTTCLMIVIWFAIILIYFGITLHMTSLGGNVYLNSVIAGSFESISIIASVFVVLKMGLRVNLLCYMFIAGTACLLINFFIHDNEFLTISFAMIIKFMVGACNAVIPTFTAYQYPTYMRNLGVGMGNLAAGFALVSVPYIFLLEHISVHLPISIMGVTALIGCIGLLLINDKLAKKNKNQNLAKISTISPPTDKDEGGIVNVSFA